MAGLTDIAKLYSRRDPLLSFKWVTEFLPTIKGISLDVSYVESIDMPYNNIKIADNWYGGAGYSYFAGPHDISAFSITFYEDSKVSVHKYLTAWKNTVKNFNTGIYGLPGPGDGSSGYKNRLKLLLLDSKNVPILRSELTGIWPADTSNLSLNYTDTGRVTLTQNFSCDSQVLTYL